MKDNLEKVKMLLNDLDALEQLRKDCYWFWQNTKQTLKQMFKEKIKLLV